MPRYLLDTNVLSELVRPVPEGRVLRWFERQVPVDLYLSSITLGELVRGIVRLPDGRRRVALSRWVSRDLRDQFEGRLLPFDEQAAGIWGTIMGECDRRGRPRAGADAQIAAIAIRFDVVVVTRNTADFANMRVKMVNPWM